MTIDGHWSAVLGFFGPSDRLFHVVCEICEQKVFEVGIALDTGDVVAVCMAHDKPHLVFVAELVPDVVASLRATLSRESDV